MKYSLYKIADAEKVILAEDYYKDLLGKLQVEEIEVSSSGSINITAKTLHKTLDLSSFYFKAQMAGSGFNNIAVDFTANYICFTFFKTAGLNCSVNFYLEIASVNSNKTLIYI